MQSVESVIVNLVIPLPKENGIEKKTKKKKKKKKKNMHQNWYIVFLLILRVPIQWRATVCMRAYSVAVSVNVHLRVQIAVLYAIAESKVFIWSF